MMQTRVDQLRASLADAVARSDIECYCTPTGEPGAWWYDISTASEDISESIEYLEITGQLIHSPIAANMVRFN